MTSKSRRFPTVYDNLDVFGVILHDMSAHAYFYRKGARGKYFKKISEFANNLLFTIHENVKVGQHRPDPKNLLQSQDARPKRRTKNRAGHGVLRLGFVFSGRV
jgi:hypothetical protein